MLQARISAPYRISATPPWQRRWAATGTAGIIAPDCKQVMLAVATDPEGIPLHVEVLRGNRADTKTLQGLLTTRRRR